MASSSLTPVIKDGERINWVELPSQLTSSILGRLYAVDILENAQKVCTTWRRMCKDPAIWRKINMRNPDVGYHLQIMKIVMVNNFGNFGFDMEIMCRHAVDRSQGGLVEINVSHFGTDSLLKYIADCSSHLRSLKLAITPMITTQGFTEALVKLPLLEDLDVSHFTLWVDTLKVVGKSCPNLKTLKLHQVVLGHSWDESDEDALAIAETMNGLRNLQLSGNGLTEAGVNAILHNCPDLEYVHLRQCNNVTLVGDLEKRYSGRFKLLRRPYDYTDLSEDEDLF